VTLSPDYTFVRIAKLSTGNEVYYKVHASDADATSSPATVAGEGTHVLPDAIVVRRVPTPADVTVVTVISAGAMRYSVEAE
jgi:hypothetical protein